LPAQPVLTIGSEKMTTQATDKDIDLVVRNFVIGMLTADEDLLRQTFHPRCRIIGHFHGELEWLSVDDFVAALLAEGPVPGEPFWQVQAVDVSGDAASVKLIDDYGEMRFTDYLSLLKIEGRWVIVNKLYHHHV
jgi:hypothetical protein